MGSYFSESAPERRLARTRVAGWVLHRQGGRGAGLRRLVEQCREAWNPTYALADAAVRGDRLPLVKLELIRFDPYGLGTAHLLENCRRAHPAEFEGVAEYLGRTAGFYPPRPAERLRSTPWALAVLRPLVAYR
jgi:hypothetical protein